MGVREFTATSLRIPWRGGGAGWAGAPGHWGWGPAQPCVRPGAPDCFFQLGNLTFAEADYQQALALSPQDEGANLRMGLLQEKMGFCEQRSRCKLRAVLGCGGRCGGGAGTEPPAGTPGSRSSALPGVSPK